MPSFSRTTPFTSRSTHARKYDWDDVHGPRLISLGWTSSPRLEPKNGQEMIGPTWNSGVDELSLGSFWRGFGVEILDILSLGEKGNAI